MNNHGVVETNFKIIAKNRTNIVLMMLLDRIRTILKNKEKATLTINVDNTQDLLFFDFLVNDNEIEAMNINNNFEIM